MNLRTFCLLATLSIAASCSSEKDAADTATIQGAWRGSAWLVFDKPSDMDASQVRFEFKPDNSYMAQFGKQMEKGQFKVKSSSYTTADDKIEKMVKILTLNADSLVIQMNRMGQEEKDIFGETMMSLPGAELRKFRT